MKPEPNQCFKCGSLVNLWARLIRNAEDTGKTFVIRICSKCYTRKGARRAFPLTLPIPLICILPHLKLKWSLSEGPP